MRITKLSKIENEDLDLELCNPSKSSITYCIHYGMDGCLETCYYAESKKKRNSPEDKRTFWEDIEFNG